jgi:hypothetical protein
MDADYSGYLSRDEIGQLLEQVYGKIMDDSDKPGEYIGGIFTPHDFSEEPEVRSSKLTVAGSHSSLHTKQYRVFG